MRRACGTGQRCPEPHLQAARAIHDLVLPAQLHLLLKEVMGWRDAGLRGLAGQHGHERAHAGAR